MLDALFQLLIFTSKAIVIVMLTLLLIAGILALLGRGKNRKEGRLSIKNLNEEYEQTTEGLSAEILPKKLFKKFLKDQKEKSKIKSETAEKSPLPNIFVLNFDGDIKASAVHSLREEVTAVLGIAKPGDEVVLRLESAGGVVHGYGLAAAQLQRIRDRSIYLTVCVDKVAASGGYMMASVADRILSAPFAIIGSIGVIVQLPNFHRLLKDKHIDFEQITAGNYKRTLTLFGENTEEGRQKLHQEIDEIHHLFKNLIQENRHQLDINKVSTGEHWLGKQALELKLVDEIKTSDDYLMERSTRANLFEITYVMKKSMMEKLFSPVTKLFFL
jgi:serine protease SohB